MAITKAKKETILEKLNAIKESAQAIVFVKFKGMKVSDSTTMRAQLRNEGVGYFVAKKTLMKKAFGDRFEGAMPTLDGEIAVAYAEDAITPAQQVKVFTDKFKDNLAIVGGVFQGVYKDATEMTAIAAIPSLQTLKGMFAQLLNSPRQRLAVVLSEVAKKK